MEGYQRELQILMSSVALIIFVTASETYDTTTAAEQYFLTLAGYTGIPVIAWNADNSGFSFGKDLTPYRIIQMAPPIEHQIRAMIALLQRYSWSKFGVVCSQMADSSEFIKSVRHEIADASNKSAKLVLPPPILIITAINSTFNPLISYPSPQEYSM
ncbi:hypothetical protein ANCDUO_14223 [Ancylostoma duodenale]|uniref:Receptor ligand binding region domain-containing protein n=1 Tax=Ancylostoma duodenale TaxID=51022 RepID=A0A0C2G3T7_9BILA|nr:hypothetical protein ANCDUO_14223 [Ancylostoma duodenale]